MVLFSKSDRSRCTGATSEKKEKRLITETAAGQHGLATVMAGNICGLKTEIFMGVKDIERQVANVKKMKPFEAKIKPVKTGAAFQTL